MTFYKVISEYKVITPLLDLPIFLKVLSSLKENGFVRGPRGGSNQSADQSYMQQYNMYSNVWPVIKACLVAGLYPNIAR